MKKSDGGQKHLCMCAYAFLGRKSGTGRPHLNGELEGEGVDGEREAEGQRVGELAQEAD